MKEATITTLFLDIGGVLLSNGWGRKERSLAVKQFDLNAEEMEERHHLTFDTYEQGKLSLDEYLKRIVFYAPRSFSEEEFKTFMFSQSVGFQDTIDFFIEYKNKYQLQVIAISNEGRELNAFRIKAFKLVELFDAFVSSSYVHLRKPDTDIFRMAMDIAHTAPKDALYVDDRLMFVEVAQSLGLHGMHYVDLEQAKSQMQKFDFIPKGSSRNKHINP